jgi:SAM-dependent methyltransferase
MNTKSLQQIHDQHLALFGEPDVYPVFSYTDKGSVHSYLSIYQDYFQKKVHDVCLLEIGIMTGGSLLLYKEFFQKYKIYGLDIADTWSCTKDFQADLKNDVNIELFFGIDSLNALIPKALQKQKFDFIIDDGDHRVSSQIRTFKNYWRLMKPDGVYFIEDIVGVNQINILDRFLARFGQANGVKFDMDHVEGQNADWIPDDRIAIITYKNYR